ncbi:MAG: manganese transport protein, partial [Fimbriimonadaceae bacterium]|nr:manganese transport protein [Fimbriimonadaceae bacterium]
NLMAILLQTMCARLGIVTGRDLAQACRDYYKKPAAIALWIACEIAIVACDLAEVIGSAIALNLLFGINPVVGVLITGLDVLLLLGLLRFGFRKIEAIIVTLVATIAACFAYEIFMAKPNWSAVGSGLVHPVLPDNAAVLIAVGIIGATVMPHNLYLHSSLVQTRAFEKTPAGKREAVRSSTIDTVIALGFAFFVNAAILILSAAVFHGAGKVVEDFAVAPQLLRPALGGAAATMFAIALLASGQSSTITATLAGQIVMEGFLRIRIAPWLRRMITRGIALIPAVAIVAVGSSNTVDMLVLSQVVLALQLPFALVPLVMFTSDRRKMGAFANPPWMIAMGCLVGAVIIGLNVYMLLIQFGPLWVSFGALVILAFGLWVAYGYKGKADVEQLPEPQRVSA